MKFSALPLLLSIAICASSASAFAAKNEAKAATVQNIELKLIRNATVKVSYAGVTFLVDPMLAKKGAYPEFEGSYRSHLFQMFSAPFPELFVGNYRSNMRNPLAELPESSQSVIAGVDAVIVTHAHLDHWDDAAQKMLPKNIPLFVQDEADALLIRAQGFTNVRLLTRETEFNGVKISKTGGQHGTDEMYAVPDLAKALGNGMGFVLQANGYKTLYLAGDTIWCKEVEQTIASFNPEVIVLNAGYAKMDGFDGAMIMGKEDVLRTAQATKNAKIVAVHLDAVNQMSLSREELRAYAKEHGIESRVVILEDGASQTF
ncbi:MAG: MBL fold metallo-hydrolase [Enterovibrio sp.]